jgi:hypothetical protein
MLRQIFIVMLLMLLTACNGSVSPLSSQLVERAIALQLNLTQQQLSQQLQLSPPKFDITHLEITQTEPLVIESLPSYHVQGTYELNLKLSQRRTQQYNRFDLYIQPQKEGKTWRLALPQFTHNHPEVTWLTYLIP